MLYFVEYNKKSSLHYTFLVFLYGLFVQWRLFRLVNRYLCLQAPPGASHLFCRYMTATSEEETIMIMWMCYFWIQIGAPTPGVGAVWQSPLGHRYNKWKQDRLQVIGIIPFITWVLSFKCSVYSKNTCLPHIKLSLTMMN